MKSPPSSVHVEDGIWLDHLFEHVFERFRRRYVEIWLIMSATWITFLLWPLQFLTMLPLWWTGEFPWRAFIVHSVMGFVVNVGVYVWSMQTFAPIRHFLAGRPADPAAVWHSAVRLMPRQAIGNTVAFVLLGSGPTITVIGRERDYDAIGYVGDILVAALLTTAAGLAFILVWEVAYRPVLRSVQPHLPDDFAPGGSWLTLSRRTALAALSGTLYTGAATSCLVGWTTTRDESLIVAVAATIGSAVGLGGMITGLVSHSVFMRVAELNTALLRIGRQEPGVRVEVRAGDEIDEAALSLNRMADRLEQADAEARASRARLASVADEERARLERELRDGVLTRLRGIGAEVADLEEQLIGDERLHRLCGLVAANVDDAAREIRSLARGVYPAELAAAGLAGALLAVATRMPVPTTVSTTGLGRLDPALERAIYFCSLEALQNAAKHAGPDASVAVRVVREHTRVMFEVRDSGRGFGGGADGSGLANMRDRIGAVGGELAISSAPGTGATIRGWVPIPQVGQSAG